MASPKPHLYNQSEQQLSILLGALGYPARVRILKLLKIHERLFVFELTDRLPIGKAAVSDHLRILREAGLIDAEEIGRYNRYSINASALRKLHRSSSGFIAALLA